MSGVGCSRDQHWLAAAGVHRCGQWQVGTPTLIPNSYGPGGKKDMENGPHTQESRHSACAPWEKATELVYYFISLHHGFY